ncbi:response regulator transcription factor [Nocardiopsis sp. RSe5-2]|uniref:Response regulator transcription factor n=1 Tax=Nocardiopsis endophytica TaxID=3018445 RepID=A0ABT4U7Q4_9ACTN|nr:response regulator transcription factor [Nocardiopsis endophytica]MDA2812984.1 response regulator transcription factor [Nocardiopsis endophytica]
MAPGDAPARVVIADDHTMFREALCHTLGSHPDVDVVGTAGTAPEAVSCAARHRPDIIVLDVRMPGGDARTTLRRLRASSPETRVIMLSMYDDPRIVHQLMHEGVNAYLHKSSSREELLSAIGAVRADGARIVVSVARGSLAALPDSGGEPLSEREKEVLRLVAAALSNAQIATRLRITQGTVKRHLRNIFKKLGAVSRIDAVNKAVAGHIITAPADSSGAAEPFS